MPSLIEREKISPLMQKALCVHIVREREKRKQEAAEAEKDSERKAKEEEEKRKKLEEEHSTLEDIKEQLIKLREKQECLRQEKHQLFSQFKKVLHEEGKHKARQREQSELVAPSSGQFQQHTMPMNPHHLIPQGSRYQTQTAYLSQAGHINTGAQLQTGMKRPHSPTTPTSGVIQMYQRPATSLHSSPHKYDNVFSGHSPYLSPAHVSSHYSHSALSGSMLTTPGRLHAAYQSGHITPERTGSGQHAHSNTIGKPQDQPMYLDDRSRSRITMIPPNQSSSMFSTSPHIRSNSPGRFNVKSEKDLVTYSPGGGGVPTQHKYPSSQNNTRIMYSKHP